ncbi:MAG: hypothetical protein ACRDZM_08050 [Acidimicrobiia bacterium]
MADPETTQPDPMGPAIMRGIAFGIPTALIGLALGIWLITDQSLRTSVVTALLPGILLGAFGGGFAGMAMTMRE